MGVEIVETSETKGLVIGSRLETTTENRRDREELETKWREVLARRTAELARSETSLEEVRRAISHDLQGPLTTITGFADLLARRCEGQLGADADEFIRFIVNSANRFDEMLGDLVTYLQVGDKRPAAAPVDCPRVVQGAVDSLPAQMANTKAMVTVEPLPHVRGDSTQIGQLFRELISNALNYCDGAPPRIRIAAKQRAGEVCFSVTDNGSGIHTSQADRAFELFQRLRAPGAPAGTGAGLAICKKIVERHGGRIWVEQTPDGGSCFRFTIPDRAPASS